jgi:hypothetical protein
VWFIVHLGHSELRTHTYDNSLQIL